MDGFAEFLKFLLDETGLFTRSEWSDFLSVPDRFLEDQIRGKGIFVLEPEQLRSLLRVLLESDYVTGVRECLAEIEHVPLAEISSIPPVQWRYTGTLGEYLCLPLVDGLKRAMSGLPLEDREKVLQDAAEVARQLKKA